MNLFEFLISPYRRADNSIYMESVTQVFNTLFEEQLGSASGLNLTNIDMGQNVKANPRKALNDIVSLILSRINALRNADTSKMKLMDSFLCLNDNTNGTPLDNLKLVGDAQIDNFKALSFAKAAVEKISSTFPRNKEDANNLIKNMEMAFKTPDGNIDKAKLNTVAAALRDFIKVIQLAKNNWFPLYTKESTPMMFVKPKKPRKPTPTFDDATYDEGDANETPTAEAEPTQTDTVAPNAATPTVRTASVKTKSTTSKAPEAAEDETIDDYTKIKDANVNLEDTTSRSIIFTGVGNVNGVVESTKQAIEIVSTVKKHLIHANAVNVSGNPDAHTVTVSIDESRVDDDPSNITNRLTKYNVFLYCLYMYIRKLYRMDSTCVLSELTAKSVLHDMGIGEQRALISLFPGKSETALDASHKRMNVDDIKSILTKDGITDATTLDNIAFAIQSCINDLGDGRLNNGKTTAELGKLVSSNQIDSSIVDELKRERDSFNTSVAQIASTQVNGADDDVYGESNGGQYDEYVKLMSSKPIFNQIADKLNTMNTEEADVEESDVELSGSYDSDAARVVDSCANLIAERNNRYRRTSTYNQSAMNVDDLFANSSINLPSSGTESGVTFDQDDDMYR